MKKLKISLAIGVVLGYIALLIYAGINGYIIHPCMIDATSGANHIDSCVSYPGYGI